jgi:hypothetical protein
MTLPTVAMPSSVSMGAAALTGLADQLFMSVASAGDMSTPTMMETKPDLSTLNTNKLLSNQLGQHGKTYCDLLL